MPNDRRSGRTTRSVNNALRLAAMGNRVLYVCHAEEFARHCARMAQELMNETLSKAVVAQKRLVQYTAHSIAFYEGGSLVGILLFRSMQLEASNPINLGLRGEQVYVEIEDHWVRHMREQERLRLEEVAAREQIQLLMDKYGWSSIHREDYPAVGNDAIRWRFHKRQGEL